MKRIVLFAGTTEGRKLCEFFINNGQPVEACVATEYGEIVLPQSDDLKIHVGRMNHEAMIEFLTSISCDLVIDATHPYAVDVTQNIKKAAKACNIRYERVIRDSYEEDLENRDDQIIFVNTLEEAVEYLNHVEGNVLITTGSKVLEPYCKVKDFEDRLTFRMLPTVEAMEACVKYGIKAKKVIGMQGPFSEEMNYLMLKELDATYLVTKESGSIGGFYEKIAATRRAGARLLVIRRPDVEQGMTVEELQRSMTSYLDNKGGCK
ncbi:MAG: precorrin-6A reductase [bacterium]|nr:precorrin-6A reductase [bacterium]